MKIIDSFVAPIEEAAQPKRVEEGGAAVMIMYEWVVAAKCLKNKSWWTSLPPTLKT